MIASFDYYHPYHNQSREDMTAGWDRDKLSKCLQRGTDRWKFLEDLQSAFVTKQEDFQSMREDDYVDRHWEVWMSTLQAVGQAHFGRQKKTKYKDDKYLQLEKERNDGLQRLGELREQLAAAPGLSPGQIPRRWGDWTPEISAEQAAACLAQKEIRQLRRQFIAKWKSDLEEDVELA